MIGFILAWQHHVTSQQAGRTSCTCRSSFEAMEEGEIPALQSEAWGGWWWVFFFGQRQLVWLMDETLGTLSWIPGRSVVLMATLGHFASLFVSHTVTF